MLVYMLRSERTQPLPKEWELPRVELTSEAARVDLPIAGSVFELAFEAVFTLRLARSTILARWQQP